MRSIQPHSGRYPHLRAQVVISGQAVTMEIRPVQVTPVDVDDEGVSELLAVAVGGGQDRTSRIVEQYRQDPRLVLLSASIGCDLVGVVGYTVQGAEVVILHIATCEKSRRAGVGSRMLRAVREVTPSHARLVAETDSDAVGFYIANGFVAESLGEKYPGVERFHVHTLTDGRTQPENQSTI